MLRSPASSGSPPSICITRPGEASQQLLEWVARTEEDPEPPVLKDLSKEMVRRRTYEHLGILPEAHPFSLWSLPKRTVRCRDITSRWKGRRVSVVAWCVTRKEVLASYTTDREGRQLAEPRHEPMAFVTFEDETALLETIWFPDAFRAYAPLLERLVPLRLHGKVDAQHLNVHLVVEEVRLAVESEPPKEK